MNQLPRPLAFACVLSLALSLPAFAHPGKGGGGGGSGATCNQQSEQPTPIELGVSGSNIDSIGNGYCCTGTLGSLVQDSSGNQYVLSNNHVMVTNNGGTIVVQPGLADTYCLAIGDQDVANLASYVPISPTGDTADAAIAQVISGEVNTAGSILNIGAISGTVATPSLDLAVEKMGRTTCLTTGKIAAVDVTISVSYPNECAISYSGTATYSGQIEIGGRGFSSAGDSGSLIVTQTTCPQAVGLLFAGSRTATFANPIRSVLSALDSNSGKTLTMVGTCTSTAAVTSGTTTTGPSRSSEALAHASDVKDRYEGDLMKLPDILGAGVGMKNGKVVIKVYAAQDTKRMRAAVPAQIEGVPVQVEVTGPIVAY